jgi:hypothetical protein
MLAFFEIMALAGIILASDADTKLREHAHAERLVERVRTQIERSRQSAPA